MDNRWHSRLKHRAAVIVFISAFLIRFLHLISLHNDPVADVLVLDSLSYDKMAQDIAFGSGLPAKVYFQSPVYPYFLAGVYRITGVQYDVVRILQMLADSVSAGLVTGIAARLFGSGAGWIAGLGMALYPVLIFESGLILKTTWTIFFTVVLLYLIFRENRQTDGFRMILIGLAGGLSAGIQGSVLLQLPLIGIWIIWESGIRNILVWMKKGVLFGLGVMLVIGPMALRNWFVAGERVLITAQGGANFYLGNSPWSDGTSKRPPLVRMTPEHEEADFHREAERALGRKLTASEASQYWWNSAREWIKGHPRDAIRLQLRKLGLFWNRVEIPDNYDFDFYRRYSIWIRYPRYPFMIVGTLGLLGMVFSLRRFRELWFLYAWTISYVMIVVAFHVYSRYRLPVVAYLWPFAGAAVCECSRMLNQRKFVSLLLFIFLGVVAVGVESLPLTHYTHSQSYFNLGSSLTRLGDLDGAETAYQTALQIMPESAPAMINLGKLAYQRGNKTRAVALWQSALRLAPDSEEIYSNLGTIAVESGNLTDAEQYFRKSVEAQPYYFLGWLHLGQVYQLLGDQHQAIASYRKAVELDPVHVQALYGLADALDQAGEPDAGRAWENYIQAASSVPSEKKYLTHAQSRLQQLKGQISP